MSEALAFSTTKIIIIILLLLPSSMIIMTTITRVQSGSATIWKIGLVGRWVSLGRAVFYIAGDIIENCDDDENAGGDHSDYDH